VGAFRAPSGAGEVARIRGSLASPRRAAERSPLGGAGDRLCGSAALPSLGL